MKNSVITKKIHEIRLVKHKNKKYKLLTSLENRIKRIINDK